MAHALSAVVQKKLAQRHSPKILKVELPQIDLPFLLIGLLPESH